MDTFIAFRLAFPFGVVQIDGGITLQYCLHLILMSLMLIVRLHWIDIQDFEALNYLPIFITYSLSLDQLGHMHVAKTLSFH